MVCPCDSLRFHKVVPTFGAHLVEFDRRTSRMGHLFDRLTGYRLESFHPSFQCRMESTKTKLGRIARTRKHEQVRSLGAF